MTVGTWIAIASGVCFLSLLALAVAFVWTGCRGRKSDDHPYCRACGFDLFGKPAASSLCSECGHDLTGRRAVHYGRSEKRWLPLSAGVVLLIILAASVTTGVVVNRYVEDWNEHKPLWWVLADAESQDEKVREAAQTTIYLKQLIHKWTDSQRRAMVDYALDRHADRSKPWDKFWGETVHTEISMRRLPDDQWQRYVRQALPTRISLRARSKVERGKPLPFEFVAHGGRFGEDMAGLELRGAVSDRTVWIDDIELKPTGGRLVLGVYDGASSWPKVGLDLGPQLERLADGPHTLRVRQRFVAFGGPGADFSRIGKSEWKASGDRTETHTVAFEMLPAGTNGLRPRQDAAVRSVLETFFVTHVVRLYRDNPTVSPLERISGGRLDLDFRGPVPPPTTLPVVLTPSVRYQGREWPLRDFFWRPGEEIPRFSLIGLAGNLPKDAARVDVKLRPNPKALEQTIDLFDYWDGEIVLRDLPILEDGVFRDRDLQRSVEERRAALVRESIAQKQAATQRAATRPTTFPVAQ